MQNHPLSGQRIVIAGGSSGIGLEVAKQVAAAGARVVIASRSAVQKHDALRETVGVDIETFACDITSASDTGAFLAQVGAIDHLVFAVRPDTPPGSFAETTPEQAQATFDCKFWGQYRMIHGTREQLNSNGSIVMTSGIAGDKIYPGASTMALINRATETLCQALAVELAPLRVNVVSPGFVAPKPAQVEQLAQRFPLGRVAAPQEVVQCYLTLLQNPYITGTTLVVDGGARLL